MARRDMRAQREQFLACRGPVRHRWELIVSSPEQRPTFGVLALFRCDNCGTERHDIFNRFTGDLAVRYYDHPDGYRETGTDLNGVRLTSSELRKEWADLVASRDVASFLDSEDNVTPIERKRRRA